MTREARLMSGVILITVPYPRSRAGLSPFAPRYLPAGLTGTPPPTYHCSPGHYEFPFLDPSYQIFDLARTVRVSNTYT